VIYLFAPRSAEESAPRIEELRPREALLQLVQNTYMNWLLDRRHREEEFHDLSEIVRQVPVRRLVAHREPCKIADLCAIIEKDAQKLLANA
jgi:hypothetical protein